MLAMIDEDKTFGKQSLLYQENAKVAAIFWEWRYKLMVSCFAGVAALFALAGWFYQQRELRDFFSAPFFLAAIFSFASFFLDRRNGKILRECYRCGKEIEIDLIGKGMIFESIGKNNTGVTYTLILGAVYLGVGVLLLLVAFWAVMTR